MLVSDVPVIVVAYLASLFVSFGGREAERLYLGMLASRDTARISMSSSHFNIPATRRRHDLLHQRFLDLSSPLPGPVALIPTPAGVARDAPQSALHLDLAIANRV